MFIIKKIKCSRIKCTLHVRDNSKLISKLISELKGKTRYIGKKIYKKNIKFYIEQKE